jgi:hypothetical protein
MKVTWKFVDQPVASPTVALDMNRQDGSLFLDMGRAFDISPPPLRRSFNTNALVDGAQLTGSSLDNRELKFSLALQGTISQKIALEKLILAQLAKNRNLLMYKPHPSATPVFFRTLRSDQYAIVNRGGSSEIWSIDCEVVAEPHAIGVRVDHTTGAVVTNDPATGTNPARLDFTGVLGDSPTPAFVRVAPGAAGGLKNNPIYLAQRTGLNFTNFLQAEAVTQRSDTATSAGDANASGTGNKLSTTTFATDATVAGRLSMTWAEPTYDPDAMRGRYRVLVRVGTNTTGSTFKIRWAMPGGNSFIRGRAVQVTLDSTKRQLVDLGMIAIPPFETPQSVGYSELSVGADDITLYIDAGRVNGGNLDFDYVYLLPADERLLIFSNQTEDAGNGAAYLILDGPQDSVYGMASGTSPFGSTSAARQAYSGLGLTPRIGGLPILTPGQTNRWYILQESATITSTLTFDVSYWPRWREVAT